MTQIASYIIITVVCRGLTAQEIFTLMKRLTPVITLVTRTVRTDEISQSAVKLKVRYLKTHVVVTCTTFARLGLKYLLHVIVVKSIIALYAAAIFHVAVAVPNSF
jgi:hypothetical protein